MAHNHKTGSRGYDGNVGSGNVGVGTGAPAHEPAAAPPPPPPASSGPIVSDDRDAADAGEVK